MKAASLDDRGILKVSGPDAQSFLNGLVTADIERVAPGAARYGALLTPQGKIVVDFIVSAVAPEDDGGFLLDCPGALADALAKKLSFYRLRARVLVENLSDRLGVVALWGGALNALPEMTCADPREPALGWRAIAPRDLAAKFIASVGATRLERSDYDALRIAQGVPNGGEDFAYGDAFPHEINMDLLHGVDFDKGCYIGQEVVSRMQHRGTARTRILRVRFAGAAPAPGTEIVAGDKPLGRMGSAAEGLGLAMLRLDRLADVRAAGAPLHAGGIALTVDDPREQALTPAKLTA